MPIAQPVKKKAVRNAAALCPVATATEQASRMRIDANSGHSFPLHQDDVFDVTIPTDCPIKKNATTEAMAGLSHPNSLAASFGKSIDTAP